MLRGLNNIYFSDPCYEISEMSAKPLLPDGNFTGGTKILKITFPIKFYATFGSREVDRNPDI